MDMVEIESIGSDSEEEIEEISFTDNSTPPQEEYMKTGAGSSSRGGAGSQEHMDMETGQTGAGSSSGVEASPPPANLPSRDWQSALVPIEQKMAEAAVEPSAPPMDDSSTAFGDEFVATFGGSGCSPDIPMALPVDGGEPNIPTAEEVADYTNWLQAHQLAERKTSPKHDFYTSSFQHGSGDESLTPLMPSTTLLPENDEAIRIFAEQMEFDHNTRKLAPSGECVRIGGDHLQQFQRLLNGDRFPAGQCTLPVFNEDERAANGLDNYDGVMSMVALSQEVHGTSLAKGKAFGQFIAPNTFIVVANNDGNGDDFQVWGPGYKRNFGRASSKQEGGYLASYLNKVPRTEKYNLNTDFVNMKDRFSIVRIHSVELGFCLHTATNTIFQMLPGRYFLCEATHRFVGKAVWRTNDNRHAIQVTPHQYASTQVQAVARRLQIVPVQEGQIGFVRHNARTYTLPATPAHPHILSEGTEIFLNHASTNVGVTTHNGNANSNNQGGQLGAGAGAGAEPVAREGDLTAMTMSASDGSSHIVVLPLHSFVLFTRNCDNKECMYSNTGQADGQNIKLHFAQPDFVFDGKVYRTSDKVAQHPSGVLTCVNLPPTEFAVIYDDQRRVRFLEGSTTSGGVNQQLCTFVLRQPCELICTRLRSEESYVHPRTNTARVYVSNGSWAAVQERSSGGNVVFYPPLMKSEPYYFDGFERRLVQLVSTNEDIVQFTVPQLGEVSIVNLRSDELGVASLTNGVCFLNPRPTPYVFVPPFTYLRTEKKSSPHINEGDLHRVYVSPSHIAAVSKDGNFQLLDTCGNNAGAKSSAGTAAEKTQRTNGGVWLFRSNNFDFYGPALKTDKTYQLGTHHFIRIDPGQVGSVIAREGMKILQPGSHVLDSAQGEFFEACYPVSVDPVEVQKIEVTSREGVKLHIDVLVTYSISDPLKTIQRFGQDHKQLEKYIADNTKAEMLRLCGGQPAVGNCKFGIGTGDTDTNSSSSSRESDSDNREDQKQQERMEEMESDFRSHVTLLAEEYGIRVEHMKILSWSPDETFMERMREEALRFQAQQAENSREMLLRQQALAQAEADMKLAEVEKERTVVENARKVLEKQQEMELVRLEQETRLQQEAAFAVAEAEKKAGISAAEAKAEAEVRAAQAKADADARKFKADADAKVSESNAKAKVVVAQQQAEQQLIQSEMEMQQLVKAAEAEVNVANARRQAEAAAQLQVAETQAKAAELEAKTLRIRAEAKIEQAKADAETVRLMGLAEAEALRALEQAKLAAVPDAQKARVLMMRDVCASVAEQAKSIKIMQHTADPSKVTQVYESCFQNSMLFQMMSGGGGNGNGMGGMMGAMDMPQQQQQQQQQQFGGMFGSPQTQMGDAMRKSVTHGVGVGVGMGMSGMSGMSDTGGMPTSPMGQQAQMQAQIQQMQQMMANMPQQQQLQQGPDSK